jgi:hypothetical protein
MGKVKRLDETAEHFADWQVVSPKKTRSLAVNDGAGRG